MADQDAQGRDRFDSFTGMYIAPMDRKAANGENDQFQNENNEQSKNGGKDKQGSNENNSVQVEPTNKKDCTTNEESGIVVYVERDGVGHAYLQVKNTIFSFGPDGKISSSGLGSGPGVLLKLEDAAGDQYVSRPYPTSCYLIKGLDENKIYNYLNNLWQNGKPSKVFNNGMIIRDYSTLSYNCAEVVVNALVKGGMKSLNSLAKSRFTPHVLDQDLYYIYCRQPVKK
jgi:hypothetical protein